MWTVPVFCTGTSGTGNHIVPKLPKCPVPVLESHRSYRSVRYRYPCRTEVTEVSGTGSDVPKLLKRPVPVIPAVYTCGMPRYVPYRTHPSYSTISPHEAAKQVYTCRRECDNASSRQSRREPAHVVEHLYSTLSPQNEGINRNLPSLRKYTTI